MKIALSWLREWVDFEGDGRTLGDRLTMAGFELESVSRAAPAFTGVVVGEIVAAERHPQADKLQVCKVSRGEGELLQIVCGAKNARVGLKAPLATVGAQLPGGFEIKAAKLRGIESAGMLCSAKELGLADSSEGLLELPAEAPAGADLRSWLALYDEIIELNITPNRGDALSVIGIAREVSAFVGVPDLKVPAEFAASAASAPARDPNAPRVAVSLDSPAAAPRFASCVITGVDNTRVSPLWLRERLRRSGLRSISPIVDVTNYVLLELGQPMHAYDLDKLSGTVRARAARTDESVSLLDGQTLQLQTDELVIADDDGAIGLAGIMGGSRTAVSAATRNVFLEVAYFAPDAIAGRARRHGLQTDASQRFERGVDPAGQERALERAVRLMLEGAGGSAGASQLVERRDQLPARKRVRVRRARVAKVLGLSIPDLQIARSLFAIGMDVREVAEGWDVLAPSYRFDVTLEADLIEEIARLVGYDRIPAEPARSAQILRPALETRPSAARVCDTLAARGYFEAVTFAFVDPALQEQLFPGVRGIALANPIASDLAVMRVSLWPGLLRVALENQRRQQDRVRLFEQAARFVVAEGHTHEIESLAGLAMGPRHPEQWSSGRETVDYFGVKADLQAVLDLSGAGRAFRYDSAALSCLHPGRSARVLRGDQPVGWIGELHPRLVRALDFTYAPILFEVDFEPALAVSVPRFSDVSRFPQVRRDLAIVIDENVPLSTLAERVRLAASSLLRDLRVFDVYRGPGVETGRKSVALGLIFQDNSRTLTDDDTEQLMASIVADLGVSLNARIRE